MKENEGKLYNNMEENVSKYCNKSNEVILKQSQMMLNEIKYNIVIASLLKNYH